MIPASPDVVERHRAPSTEHSEKTPFDSLAGSNTPSQQFAAQDNFANPDVFLANPEQDFSHASQQSQGFIKRQKRVESEEFLDHLSNSEPSSLFIRPRRNSLTDQIEQAEIN